MPRWPTFVRFGPLALLSSVIACAPNGALSRGAGHAHHLSEDEIAAIPNSFPTTVAVPGVDNDDGAEQMLASELTANNVVERAGQLVSTLIDLRDVRVPMRVRHCGQSRASYDPRSAVVDVCYEFVERVNDMTDKPPAQFDSTTRSMIVFTALHEIAHALIDQLRFELDGNEEDRADQFAILIMTDVADPALATELVHAPVVFFEQTSRYVRHDPTDPHSAAIERANAARCLLYGRYRDPELGRALGARAAGCVAFTEEVRADWNRVLAPRTRLDTGRTF